MFTKRRQGQFAFRIALVLASLFLILSILTARGYAENSSFASSANVGSDVNARGGSSATNVTSSSGGTSNASATDYEGTANATGATGNAGNTSNSGGTSATGQESTANTTGNASTSSGAGAMSSASATSDANSTANSADNTSAAQEVSIYDAAKAAAEASSDGNDIAFVNASSASFRLHMQTYGSEVFAADGLAASADKGAESYEAVRITLVGDLAKDHDVWYRVHARNIGWLAWTNNGNLAGTSGLAWNLGSLQIIILPKGLSAEDYVTDILSVIDSAYLVFPGAFDLTRTQARTPGWKEWDIEGDAFGVFGKTRYLEAAKIKLTGDVSSTYNGWYRTLVKGYGWLGWALNGQTSGVLGRTNRIEALEIRIMPKDAAALGSTTYACRALISGDAELDSMLDAIINTQTSMGQNALREAFDYITTLPYIDGATEYRGDWRDWSIPVAKQMYRRPGGNCYGYGALMAWVARALGYDARAVSGEIQSGVLVWSYHGWCEITQGGKKYVLDPDLQKYVTDRNFYMVSYEDAPTYYTAYEDTPKRDTVYENETTRFTYYTLD